MPVLKFKHFILKNCVRETKFKEQLVLKLVQLYQK
jgi:hypothetical protein